MDRNEEVTCGATFKEHCQFPKCDCDREVHDDLCNCERCDLEGKCHALWLLEGNETYEWNGVDCGCEEIQGQLNCKLNTF